MKRFFDIELVYLLKLLLQENSVEFKADYKALTQFADSAKQFLSDGNISLTLMSQMKLYE